MFCFICGLPLARDSEIDCYNLVSVLVIDVLTLLGPMEFSIKFDTVMSGWSIVYIKGSQIIISKKYYISFSED